MNGLFIVFLNMDKEHHQLKCHVVTQYSTEGAVLSAHGGNRLTSYNFICDNPVINLRVHREFPDPGIGIYFTQ
jgi:hypothetical protein